MNSKDKLFELISSLSQGEKIHFRKFANIYSDKSKNYIKLYESTEEQSRNGEYNEKIIKDFYKVEKFINNLSEIKSYLFDSILKSLSLSQNDASEILLKQAEILYSKNLYRPAWSALNRAKQKAIKKDNNSLLLRILEIEYELLLVMDSKNTQSEFERLQKEEEVVIKKIENLNNFKYFEAKLVAIRKQKGLFRTNNERNIIKEILRNDLFQSERKALTDQSKLFYFNIKATAYFVLADFQKSYEYFSQQLNFIESSASLMWNINDYALTLRNFIAVAILVKKFQHIPEHMKKLDNLLNNHSFLSKTDEARLFFEYFSINLITIIYLRNIHFSPNLLIKAEDWLNTNPQEFTKLAPLFLKLSQVYFNEGNFERALYWVNRILNEGDTDKLMSVIIPSKILNLFIHYELRNLEYLSYEIKNFNSFLLKKRKLYKFEKILIEFIKKVVNPKYETISLLKDFKKKLELIRENPFEVQVFLEYFDSIAWAESKIEFYKRNLKTKPKRN